MAVVVGYVATPEGRAALRRAAEECRTRSVNLVVVDARSIGSDQDEGEAALARQELDRVLAELDGTGTGHEIRTPNQGDELADALLATATDVSADLVVIGLRRRSPVGKLILGSNAQRVLLDAHCPVLTVKADS